MLVNHTVDVPCVFLQNFTETPKDPYIRETQRVSQVCVPPNAFSGVCLLGRRVQVFPSHVLHL